MKHLKNMISKKKFQCMEKSLSDLKKHKRKTQYYVRIIPRSDNN